MTFEKFGVYMIEGYQLEKIDMIMKRLFDDCSALQVGERRDMANKLFLILSDTKNNLMDEK